MTPRPGVEWRRRFFNDPAFHGLVMSICYLMRERLFTAEDVFQAVEAANHVLEEDRESGLLEAKPEGQESR